MGLLTGKTALITGAARGIGKAIALKFASEGANIAFTDLVIDENGKATEAEIAAFGVKAKGYASNAADFAQSEEVANAVKAEFGSIDILVNNAGITRDNLLMRMKEEEWSDIIDTNLTSVFYLSKAMLRSMMKKRYGRIINIGSVVGSSGNPGQTNYCAAKAGLIGFSKALAQEVASRGITVNVVSPGFIATDMTHALTDDQKQVILSQVPAGKLGEAKDIAKAVAFLASEDAGYITGTTLHVNGGLYMN